MQFNVMRHSLNICRLNEVARESDEYQTSPTSTPTLTPSTPTNSIRNRIESRITAVKVRRREKEKKKDREKVEKVYFIDFNELQY